MCELGQDKEIKATVAPEGSADESVPRGGSWADSRYTNRDDGLISVEVEIGGVERGAAYQVFMNAPEGDVERGDMVPLDEAFRDA